MASVAAQPGDTLVEPHSPGLTRSGAARLDAIDMLRGLVIAIMVLDHVRDFFHVDAFAFDPTDPLKTNALLFATRWVTHLCAPTFVFLAGASIWFQRQNGKTGAALSGFLLKRGLWLILLEATVVTFGFNFAEPFLFLQVIWAIGASMICMAALARLPARVVLGIGIAIVALYLPVIPLTEGAAGLAGVIRNLAIVPNFFPGPPVPVVAFYPFVPWLGVMCLGFGLGPVFAADPARRLPMVLAIVLAMFTLFVLLRGLNWGDPVPWRVLDSGERTLFSFLAVTKYPPSPDYVLVTLSISLLLFLALERLRGPLARLLLIYGRTPLFTYLLHIYIAHGLMLLAAVASGFPASVATNTVGGGAVGTGWGYSLGTVYLVWLLVLALLYPLSRWFEGVKRRRRDWWLSYL